MQPELVHELAREVVGYVDLNYMALSVGIDYPVLLDRALSKDESAIYLLIWMGGNANLDGAGSEGYSFSMVAAARLIGDELMAEVATKVDDASLKEYRWFFEFEYGVDSDKDLAEKNLAKDFPKLWSILQIK